MITFVRMLEWMDALPTEALSSLSLWQTMLGVGGDEWNIGLME